MHENCFPYTDAINILLFTLNRLRTTSGIDISTFILYRFANSAMKMNDPLQTLYQLMSGRQPATVTVSTTYLYMLLVYVQCS